MNKVFLKKFNAVIVGLGGIGLEYDLSHNKDYVLTHSKSFMNHGGFELVCGVDRDIERCRKFESFTKKPGFLELSSIPKDRTYDVFIIAIPPGERDCVLKECLYFKPKLILMEKPLALDVEEANRLIELCEKSECELAVNYMRRCEPTVQKLKKDIEDNRFGSFLGGNTYYTRGIRNNASHFMDLYSYLVGKPSSWGVLERKEKKEANKDPEFDFWISIKNARCVFQSVSSSNFSIGKADFIFENAVIYYDDFGRNITIRAPEDDPQYKGYRRLKHIAEKLESGFVRCQQYVPEHIYQHFVEGIDLVSSANSGLQTLIICEDLIEQWQK
ncbi:MAG: Gfo/Idh/MocA family oxidoreductase [Deltaproteobacteria bacterium]|nr:Gfo/Idh/MocA family oxidoreductase [Deltaproteobacteria bacterium]